MAKDKDSEDLPKEDLEAEVEDLSGEDAQEDVESLEEGAEDMEIREGYAFPMAPIVRLMKAEMDKDKMIRRRVKEGMNTWLEGLCRKVAVKMNESEYTMVELDDFKTAIEPYEMIDEVEQERQRIIATLEKIKQDCDSLILDVERKFMTP
ncbi:MAG: hypothetical protein GF334_13950 [Candidatus Altiarchaeales archaeon]|nr:hypothetical protein [Candidatus Altiarchaeales archaeon]